MTNIIAVKHNIEVAHRLSELEGRCENIHGHSMWVTLEIYGGEVNAKGIYEGIEFGALKKDFRAYLDHTYDHHLLLNQNDPWAQEVLQVVPEGHFDVDSEPVALPGLIRTIGDPTSENIANWINAWAIGWLVDNVGDRAPTQNVSVKVWETSVNMAQVIR